MLQTTRWSPDTCGCIIDYQWDDKEAQENRVHTTKAIIKACPFHEHHDDKHDHYADVRGENQSKNTAVSEVAKVLSVDPHDVDWSFDQDRTIIVSHKDLTENHKAELSALTESKCVKPVRFE